MKLAGIKIEFMFLHVMTTKQLSEVGILFQLVATFGEKPDNRGAQGDHCRRINIHRRQPGIQPYAAFFYKYNGIASAR